MKRRGEGSRSQISAKKKRLNRQHDKKVAFCFSVVRFSALRVGDYREAREENISAEREKWESSSK
jgi:hypothetical protein